MSLSSVTLALAGSWLHTQPWGGITSLIKIERNIKSNSEDISWCISIYYWGPLFSPPILFQTPIFGKVLLPPSCRGSSFISLQGRGQMLKTQSQLLVPKENSLVLNLGQGAEVNSQVVMNPADWPSVVTPALSHIGQMRQGPWCLHQNQMKCWWGEEWRQLTPISWGAPSVLALRVRCRLL